MFVEIDSQTPGNAYFLLVNITAKNELDEIYASHFFCFNWERYKGFMKKLKPTEYHNRLDILEYNI